MNIILEDSLKQHMAEENICDIVVEVGECIACGGGYKNVTARFLEEGEDPASGGQRLTNFDVIPTEFGSIYLPKEGIEYGDTLRFVWKNYYWLDGLGVSGATAIQG